ncbi:MAG: sugar transporter substrate-binding protein [Clostridia bacterium]|jgi:raffinose/stachyose/melibiose transport system substrate-binding protein|nr:sugar transporter substrate-binding protein [Clostridia bacterium]
MKKRIVNTVGITVLCVSLLMGCQPKAAEDAQTAAVPKEAVAEAAEPAKDAEPATVDILQFKVEIAEELENAAKLYMESHKNVTINIESSSSYQSDLRAKMSGTDQPEIFCIDGPEHILNWGDQLENLSDQPWVKEVNDGLLGAVTNDKGIWGLPMTIEGYGFIYNKAIFEAAGIDLEAAKTYEEVDKAFAELKKKIDSGELAEEFPVLEAVTEFPAGEKWVGGLHTANLVLSCEFGSAMEAFEAPGIEFKYAKAFKDLIDLQAKYSPSADSLDKLNTVDYGQQVGGGLLIERVAVIQQGNWITAEVMAMDPAFLDKLGMIGMPVTGAAEGKLPVGVPTNWAVNAKSSDADKAAAKDFLNWLYTSEEGKDIVVNKLSFIPVMKGYDNLTVSDPLGKAIQKYSAEGNTIGWITSAFPAGWSDGVMGTSIQQYLAGKASWDDIIADAKVQWSDLKKK